MSVFAGALIAFAVILLLSFVAMIVAIRMTYNHVRRSRLTRVAALRSRAAFSTGPMRKVLRLRVRLDDSLHSGELAIDLVTTAVYPRSELLRLFRRVQSEAAALDAQLRLMESETESAVLVEELPLAARRVDQVAELVRQVRAAVAMEMPGVNEDSLDLLGSEIDNEVAAVAAGVEELRRLSERPRRPVADRPFIRVSENR